MDGCIGSFSVDSPCREALSRLRQSLERKGLRALQTFDLQIARSSGAQCTCPRHGTADCDCQLVVLLIYGEGTAPAALMLHGSDGHTWISFPDGTPCAAESVIEAAVASSIGGNQAHDGL